MGAARRSADRQGEAHEGEHHGTHGHRTCSRKNAASENGFRRVVCLRDRSRNSKPTFHTKTLVFFWLIGNAIAVVRERYRAGWSDGDNWKGAGEGVIDLRGKGDAPETAHGAVCGEWNERHLKISKVLLSIFRVVK